MKKAVFFFNLALSCLSVASCSPRFGKLSGQQGPQESVVADYRNQTSIPQWPPLPHENRIKGRNSNAYEPYLGEKDEAGFMGKVKPAALNICREHKVPASVIVAMAAGESGFGSTRLAYHANNYFSTKVWGRYPPKSWQLIGQPDESVGSQDVTRVVENLGKDRLIFDERTRADNHYRAFKTPEDSFKYLAEAFLKRPNKTDQKKPGYIDAATKWLKTVTSNPGTIEEAAKQYVYEIAEAGYNHKGGKYYRNFLSQIMDKHNLYELDRQCLTKVPVIAENLTIHDDIKVFPSIDSHNMKIKGIVNIQVKVTDYGSGVNRVEFFAHRHGEEGEAKSTDVLIQTLEHPTDPVDSVYLVSWDTTKAGPDGTYSIIVQAYDNAQPDPTFTIKTRTVELRNGSAASSAPSTTVKPGNSKSSQSGSAGSPVNGTFGACKHNGRSGTCIDKAYCQGGKPVAGLCTGPTSVQCCVWD